MYYCGYHIGYDENNACHYVVSVFNENWHFLTLKEAKAWIWEREQQRHPQPHDRHIQAIRDELYTLDDLLAGKGCEYELMRIRQDVEELANMLRGRD